MKRTIMIICTLTIIVLSGCESMKLDGVSIGATYLDANVQTKNTIKARQFGEFPTEQTTRIKQIMPIVLFNFKFK